MYIQPTKFLLHTDIKRSQREIHSMFSYHVGRTNTDASSVTSQSPLMTKYTIWQWSVINIMPFTSLPWLLMAIQAAVSQVAIPVQQSAELIAVPLDAIQCMLR